MFKSAKAVISNWFGKTNYGDGWISGIGGFSSGAENNYVNPTQAMGLSALQRAITLFVDNLSATPVYLMQSSTAGGSKRITDTDLAKKLALWQFHDRELSFFDLMLAGNGFLLKETMKPIAGWRVEIQVEEDGTIRYRVEQDFELNEPEVYYREDEIIHFRYRTTGRNSVLGISPLQSGNPAIALYKVVRDTATTLYQNLAISGFILSTQLELDADQTEALSSRTNAKATGKNKGSTIILSHGLEQKEMNLKRAVDMELEKIMKLSVAEVSRLYGVPNQLLGETSDVSYSSGTELMRSFTLMSLQPLITRISDTLTHALLTPDEILEGFSVRLDISNQLLGFGKERSDFLSQMVNNGLMSVNESRNAIDLEDVDGGNELRAPISTVSLTNWEHYQAPVEPPPAEPAPAPAEPTPTTEPSKSVIAFKRSVPTLEKIYAKE